MAIDEIELLNRICARARCDGDEQARADQKRATQRNDLEITWNADYRFRRYVDLLPIEDFASAVKFLSQWREHFIRTYRETRVEGILVSVVIHSKGNNKIVYHGEEKIERKNAREFARRRLLEEALRMDTAYSVTIHEDKGEGILGAPLASAYLSVYGV